MHVSLLAGVLSVVAIIWQIKKLFRHEKRLHRQYRHNAKKLLKKIRKHIDNPAIVFGILRRENCFVFEELLLLCLQKHGFRIARNNAYTGDGGVDGTFYDSEGNKFLVQAKRYSNAINPRHVSDFAAVVRREKAAGGFFVHTGRTGGMSYKNLVPEVRIISGRKLLRLMRLS